MVMLCGEEFKSIKEASIWYGISVSVLKSRIKAHGSNWIHLFDEPIHYNKQRKDQIMLLGQTYKSISDAAKKHNIRPSTLANRVNRHGNNWPYLFDKPMHCKHHQNLHHKQHKDQIMLLGQAYKSISDAARKHDIRPSTLANRVNRHGNNWPYLFDKLYSSNSKTYKQNKLNKLIPYPDIIDKLYLKQSALLHDNEWPLRNVNKRLEQYQALQKAYKVRKQMRKDATNAIHQQNCVTLNDVAKECDVLINDLQCELYKVVNNNSVPISGFYKTDVVLFKKHHQYPGRISPKYVLKREAIQHIKDYQAKIAQTVIIPFTNNRYFYSTIENCVYSKIVTKNKIHFRKINPRMHSDVPNMSPRYLLYLKPYVTVDINLNTIKDIVEYPTITVDDLISTKELQKAYGHNFKSFIILPKLHIRFDSQGHTKRGYIKSQIRFKKKRSDK